MTHLDSGPLYHPALLDRGETRGVVHTDDLFLTVYVLLRGGELLRIEVGRPHGRPTAYLVLGGDEVEDAVREFHRGPVLADLRLFKHELRRVKDMVFDALRAEERTHASGGEGSGRPRRRSESDRAGRR